MVYSIEQLQTNKFISTIRKNNNIMPREASEWYVSSHSGKIIVSKRPNINK